MLVNVAADGKATRAELAIVLGEVAPDDGQVVDDPVLLIVQHDALLQESQLFQVVLVVLAITFRAHFVTLDLIQKVQLEVF